MRRTKVPWRILAVVILGWSILLLAGFGRLLTYSSVPGPEAPAQPVWPAEARWIRHPERATLVLFLHPQCPCSAATLSELERMLPQLGGRADIHLSFVLPAARTADWARAQLWRRAERFPGVELSVDEGGREAERFGARTSGETYLYAPSGQLLFRGGITSARGHEGDSAGKSAVLAYFRGQPVPVSGTRTFGCAIHSREEGS